MNRYSVVTFDPYDMTPDADGIWVPYDEAAAEIERNRAAIAELVGALVAAEELYRVGLIYAKDGLIEEVVNLRQAALTKHQQPPISEQSTTTTKE